MALDRIDRRILRHLQQDADITNAALAEAVGLSPSTCLRRVQKLKDQGVIRRTVAVIDPAAVGRGQTAVVSVQLTHHGSPQRQDFIARLRREPAVMQAWGVTGEPDVILILQLGAMTEYQGVIERLFAHDPLVERFYTYVAVATYKDVSAVPLDEE
ncbi:Lrp/AsnC family transcriptional regulator [Caenispirillum bisanense]|uniref:Lrp/AsnC family transcriptional regulator n=1 Tax=Caenispirillum bisanense TaxID=414052 RepID=UPI0031D7F472